MSTASTATTSTTTIVKEEPQQQKKKWSQAELIEDNTDGLIDPRGVRVEPHWSGYPDEYAPLYMCNGIKESKNVLKERPLTGRERVKFYLNSHHNHRINYHPYYKV